MVNIVQTATVNLSPWKRQSGLEPSIDFTRPQANIESDAHTYATLRATHSFVPVEKSQQAVFRFLTSLNTQGVLSPAPLGVSNVIVAIPSERMEGGSFTNAGFQFGHFDGLTYVRPTARTRIPSLFHGGWHVVNRMLNRWAAFKQDWDGEDGIAPSDHVIACAKRFIARIMVQPIVPPSPFIAGDGEVGFRWAEGESFASVAFLDDGSIVAYCHAPNMTSAYTLDGPAHENDELLDLIHSLKGFSVNHELDGKI